MAVSKLVVCCLMYHIHDSMSSFPPRHGSQNNRWDYNRHMPPPLPNQPYPRPYQVPGGQNYWRVAGRKQVTPGETTTRITTHSPASTLDPVIHSPATTLDPGVAEMLAKLPLYIEQMDSALLGIKTRMKSCFGKRLYNGRSFGRSEGLKEVITTLIKMLPTNTELPLSCDATTNQYRTCSASGAGATGDPGYLPFGPRYKPNRYYHFGNKKAAGRPTTLSPSMGWGGGSGPGRGHGIMGSAPPPPG